MKRSNSTSTAFTTSTTATSISTTSTSSGNALEYKIVKNILLTKEYQLQNRYNDQLYTFRPIKGEYSQLLKYTVPISKARPGKWQNTSKYLEVRGYYGVINFQTLIPEKEYQIDICSMKTKTPDQYIWKWSPSENCFILMTYDQVTLIAKLTPAKLFTRELASLQIFQANDIALKTTILMTSIIIWDEYYKTIPTFSRFFTKRRSFPVLWKCINSY